MYDIIRRKLDGIGFSPTLIEAIITYIQSHPEELIRLEERLGEHETKK